ncbi:S41 family peptidase [Candidatus Korobacter versatilis]|nr:S41 family peptidase [Candidatus Koribacter versatilis]
MSKITKFVLLSSSLLVVLFVVYGSLGVRADSKNDGAYRQLGVYSEVLSRIRTEYVVDPDMNLVTDGALHGLLESLDANSSYLSPTEYKQYQQRKSEGKAGIGAAISKRYGYAAVVSVIPGGPADKAQVESGDIIEAIEGKTTREMSLAEIDGILAGQPGSVINLSIVRPRKAQPQKTPITREVVTTPPVAEKLMEDSIGYIKVITFTKGRTQQVAEQVKAAQKQGAKKLILDLRNCGAGEEQEGVATANLFLNHGMIAYLQGQKFAKQTFTAEASKAITNLPLVVLVNKGTAGPAEIVAASVLENARGDVLGDKTFGDGAVQQLFPMSDGSALMLSIAKYYSPSGKAIQDTAVTPNILVADNDDYASPDDGDDTTDNANQPETRQKDQTDEQLRRAVEVLKNKDQHS